MDLRRNCRINEPYRTATGVWPRTTGLLDWWQPRLFDGQCSRQHAAPWNGSNGSGLGRAATGATRTASGGDLIGWRCDTDGSVKSWPDLPHAPPAAQHTRDGRPGLRNWFRIPLTVKLFLGLLLIQVVTALLLYAWWRTGSTDAALTFGALAIASALFAALWLAAVARGHSAETLLRAEGNLARERERHRRLTAEERARAVEHARRQVERETQRIRNRSNVKLYGAFAGVAGLGTLLLLTQFLSLGVLLISSSGGAVAGYLLRARQEARRQNQLGREEVARLVPGTRVLQAPDDRASATGSIHNEDSHK